MGIFKLRIGDTVGNENDRVYIVARRWVGREGYVDEIPGRNYYWAIRITTYEATIFTEEELYLITPIKDADIGHVELGDMERIRTQHRPWKITHCSEFALGDSVVVYENPDYAIGVIAEIVVTTRPVFSEPRIDYGIAISGKKYLYYRTEQELLETARTLACVGVGNEQH